MIDGVGVVEAGGHFGPPSIPEFALLFIAWFVVDDDIQRAVGGEIGNADARFVEGMARGLDVLIAEVKRMPGAGPEVVAEIGLDAVEVGGVAFGIPEPASHATMDLVVGGDFVGDDDIADGAADGEDAEECDGEVCE